MAEQTANRQWWIIEIVGYGEFAYYGDEKEAEEMRAHKSKWERGTGFKRTTSADSPLVQRQIAWVKREIGLGYPRASERERAETEAALKDDHAGVSIYA